MPFNVEVTIKAALRAGYRCEMCGEDLSGVLPDQVSALFHIHSVTTLHLVRLVSDPSLCLVTDPPLRLSKLKGRTLPVDMFSVFSEGRDDDGFCLCQTCHSEIHAQALSLTKSFIPHHKGRNASPAILEEVSLFCILRGYV